MGDNIRKWKDEASAAMQKGKHVLCEKLMAKTVADCFKYRNKVGIDVAIEALRDFSRRHRGGATELARFARICRVTRVMQPYLDAIA